MKKNKSTTTNTPQTTTHVQRENQTAQSRTGENLIFDTKQIERMTTQQLRRQTKLRGIPISYKQKYFTSAKNLNSIYTHDRNMKKKLTSKQKHVYAEKTNPTKIPNTTETCNLRKIIPHIIPTDQRNKLQQKPPGLSPPTSRPSKSTTRFSANSYLSN